MLAHVSVLDTAAASRGAVSVGWPGSVQQACAVLPALRTARLNSSQASLVELLLHAAPKLSRIELSVTGVTPTVVRLLARLPALASLDLQLAHPGWAKACAGLGALSQLQQLSIAGRPMDEAARHGEGCVSCSFWESCIVPLSQLSSLSVNPWIKALPGAREWHGLRRGLAGCRNSSNCMVQQTACACFGMYCCAGCIAEVCRTTLQPPTMISCCAGQVAFLVCMLQQRQQQQQCMGRLSPAL
jgi:hypothetical protein